MATRAPKRRRARSWEEICESVQLGHPVEIGDRIALSAEGRSRGFTNLLPPELCQALYRETGVRPRIAREERRAPIRQPVPISREEREKREEEEEEEEEEGEEEEEREREMEGLAEEAPSIGGGILPPELEEYIVSMTGGGVATYPRLGEVSRGTQMLQTSVNASRCRALTKGASLCGRTARFRDPETKRVLPCGRFCATECATWIDDPLSFVYVNWNSSLTPTLMLMWRMFGTQELAGWTVRQFALDPVTWIGRIEGAVRYRALDSLPLETVAGTRDTLRQDLACVLSGGAAGAHWQGVGQGDVRWSTDPSTGTSVPWPVLITAAVPRGVIVTPESVCAFVRSLPGEAYSGFYRSFEAKIGWAVSHVLMADLLAFLAKLSGNLPELEIPTPPEGYLLDVMAPPPIIRMALSESSPLSFDHTLVVFSSTFDPSRPTEATWTLHAHSWNRSSGRWFINWYGEEEENEIEIEDIMSLDPSQIQSLISAHSEVALWESVYRRWGTDADYLMRSVGEPRLRGNGLYVV